MDYSIAEKWKLFIGFIVLSTVGGIQPATSQNFLLNTPPLMHVERNWRISETEPVGSIIARVRAEDAENDQLKFGLEPHYHGDYANPSATGKINANLPFQIDENTGVVSLNESLIGRGNENSFLYITVSDGTLTAKTEVYVNIVSKGDPKKLYGSRTPSLTQATQNLSSFLPPFHLLPGVQSIRNQPSNHGLPLNQLPSGPPQINSNNIYPPFNRATNSPTPPPPPQSSQPVDINSNINIQSNDVSSNSNLNSNSNTNPNRTKLTPIKTKNDEGTENDDKLSATSNDKSSKPKKNNGNDNNGNQVEISQDDNNTITTNTTNATSILRPIIPVVATICAIFIAAGLIALFIYRKRLCAIGKTLKKKSKAEMAKKSNQSNISSNLTDDSRNSMVLQHWNGPTAFGNRYVPWERDNQQLSLATSQLSTSDSRMSGVSVGIGNGIGGIVNGVNGIGCGIPAEMKPDQWEYPRHRLKFLNILGEGAFGQVWRCDATNPDGIKGVTTVAVKTLKENATEIEKNDLHTELKVMKSLTPHKNVVRLLGCCTDKDPIFVIIEYVNRGKLQDYLRSSRAERHYGNTHGKSNILTSGDLISFMYQVAKGMDYLTSRGLIHRDLAARNILITDDHICKVADFGFARDVIASKVYERKSQGKQPIRWMAIESLYDNIFSAKSDIWSFGILMWEIVTLGSTPYPGKSAEDIMRKVRDGYRLEKPEHCRRELYNIMYYCWEKDPDDRPTFSELVRMFDKLLHTEMDYIELESFPDHNYYNILNLSGEKV